jgi:hypothetical protein
MLGGPRLKYDPYYFLALGLGIGDHSDIGLGNSKPASRVRKARCLHTSSLSYETRSRRAAGDRFQFRMADGR